MEHLTACCALDERTYRVRFCTGDGDGARVGVFCRGWGLRFGVRVGVECWRLVCAKMDGRSRVVFLFKKRFRRCFGRLMGSCTLV